MKIFENTFRRTSNNDTAIRLTKSIKELMTLKKTFGLKKKNELFIYLRY